MIPLHKQLALLSFFVIFLLPQYVHASSTNGTIDTTLKYAWSNNGGWVNFDASNGNVHVTDTAITGYVWNDNHGWFNLAPSQGGVTNNGNGTLGGYAWSTDFGWINFSGVNIDTNGRFHGQATGSGVGILTFDCLHCAVTTDWRPVSARSSGTPPPPPPPPSGSGGGSGGGAGGGGTVNYTYGCIDPKASNFNPSANYSNGTCTYSTTIPGFPNTGTLGTEGSSTVIKTVANTIPNFQNLMTQPVLPLGAVSENIRTLQIFLNAMGFTLAKTGPGSPGHETNIFGFATKAALAKFQTANGITPATGYFGPQTRALIATLSHDLSQITVSPPATTSIFTRDLERGMSGPDVIALQQLLIATNAGPAARALARSGVSTYFGAFTKAAVIEYQKAHDITPAAGYVGPKTRAFIAQ